MLLYENGNAMKESKQHASKGGENREEQFTVVLEPEMQKFVTRMNIRPEDFEIIQKLSAFPNVLIIELAHNLFNMSHERSGWELQQCIAHANVEYHREIYQLLYEFFVRYDWVTCYSLVRILEERSGTPNIYKWEREGRGKK
ncbi:MAG: hypothetical protein A3D65_00775 [Candidatus Lloydbacteria bacterium RIFCSPHIGHO2_02_FULL_50_13]|uniref:Uncharacterized protein n=1 Tax=Candidatus Lloydbacteria bacterium RIFCSPHIGHO2_02_FULL_50_13 TaxID=1798661 RepID=A0A1G2D126_9BACT|nr:MAG: hypothetical protein A3D65_00775 [Candidatus Lloydbacteria bacterium RIFCSPHIGHO2_02_FULL_50_13]